MWPQGLLLDMYRDSVLPVRWARKALLVPDCCREGTLALPLRNYGTQKETSQFKAFLGSKKKVMQRRIIFIHSSVLRPVVLQSGSPSVRHFFSPVVLQYDILSVL
jgi:hypothetical protein